MAAKKTSTAMIKASLRRNVWLRSPERSAAKKATDNHCTDCGVKFTRRKAAPVKENVHHIDAIEEQEVDGITYSQAVEVIRKILTPDPSRLAALCKECHLVRHAAPYATATNPQP